MNKKVEEAVKTLMSEMNVMGRDHKKAVEDAIYQTVSQEHRTIQQTFWGIMLKVQMRYAENSSDLRNEASVKLAQAVKETATKLNFDYGLPYV